MMALSGKFTPGFTEVIALSFHLVIRPRKISARASGVNFTSPLTPGMLYAGTTAPNTVGIFRIFLFASCNCLSVMGISLAPKSTVAEVNWRIPPPLPMGW